MNGLRGRRLKSEECVHVFIGHRFAENGVCQSSSRSRKQGKVCWHSTLIPGFDEVVFVFEREWAKMLAFECHLNAV